MEHLRMVGKWWLPATPDAQVGGVLEIDADGQSRLELTDSLLNDSLHAVLHGAADGRPVTLLNCQPMNGGKITWGQLHTVVEVGRPTVILVGIHLAAGDDVGFNGIEVELSNLTAWTRRSGIIRTTAYTTPDEGTDHYKFARVEINPTKLEQVSARLEDASETVTLAWRLNWGSKEGAWDRDFEVEERATLTVRSDERRAWSGFTPTVSAVRDLITLATQAGCRVGKKSLLIREDGETRDYPVGLYFDSGSARERSVSVHDIIFTLEDIEWATLKPEWVALRNRVGLALDVLFSLDYIEDGFYQNRIFNAASATEGFHAALRPESVGISDALHQDVKVAVKALFPDNLEAREWLRGRTGDPLCQDQVRHLQQTKCTP
ncbi:hypothetical protein [Rhodococcus sovatensis]|uniref:ApeA N-terminal domain-containing protein n=1 Tax=Rhodococcus sovatensis TaxID=1805840 RepID=A0ABZ2PNM2_9NOCA